MYIYTLWLVLLGKDTLRKLLSNFPPFYFIAWPHKGTALIVFGLGTVYMKCLGMPKVGVCGAHLMHAKTNIKIDV